MEPLGTFVCPGGHRGQCDRMGANRMSAWASEERDLLSHSADLSVQYAFTWSPASFLCFSSLMASRSAAPVSSRVELRCSSSASSSVVTFNDSSLDGQSLQVFLFQICLSPTLCCVLANQLLTWSPVSVLSTASRKLWSSSFLLANVLMILHRASCLTHRHF